MRKNCLSLIALLMFSIYANSVFAQTEVYSSGNVRVLQFSDSWQILHGKNPVAHGDGVLNIGDLPPAFSDFLDYFSKLPLSQSPVNKISKSTSPIYGPLINTHWNQDSPYNNLCPESDGRHTVTGCTTISSAQLMFYYGYCKPLNLSGSNTTWYEDIKSDYITKTTKNEYNTTYEYSYSYTPDFDKISVSENELAKFIVGIAFAQKALFGLYSTSTNTCDQFSALKDIFGYECEMYDISSLDDKSLISDAIKKGMPVLIDGSNEQESGHSFLIDGYNGTEYHVNYGWGGNSDGWFIETQYPQNNTIIIARPGYEKFVSMQNKPQYLYVSGNGVNKKIEMVSDGGDGLSYRQKDETELEAGEYEFYFEYADGSKIAPSVESAVDLEKGFTTYGRFAASPAKLKLSKTYKVDFFHMLGKGSIKVSCADYHVAISGKVSNEDGQPLADAWVAMSETKPKCEALQKNENEVDWVCALPYFSTAFTPTKPYLTQVDFIALKVGNPKEFTVSIQNTKNEKLWEKNISAENVGHYSEWMSVEIDYPLSVTPGDTYYLVIEFPYYDGVSDSYFRIANDADHNLLYRVWSTDSNFQRTDSDGNFSLDVNRHSSGTLYVFYDKTMFEPFVWDNIQRPVSDCNFRGKNIFVTISGTVSDKNSKKISGAYVSVSETKPENTVLQKIEGMTGNGWYLSSKKIEFTATKKYLSQFDFSLGVHGTPKGVTVSVEDDGKTVCKISVPNEKIVSWDWTEVVFEDQPELEPGKTYTIVLTPESSDGSDDCYYYQHNDADEMVYRIWGTDNKYVKTDATGRYSFMIPRYSSSKLYANSDGKKFNAVNLLSVSKNVSGIDFIESGKDETFDFSVESIVVTPPTKIEYIEGQELELGGGKITVNYNNGESPKDVELSTVEISEYDKFKTGVQTLTVKYLGKEASFDVTVKEKTVVSIELTNKPEKLEYVEGQNLSLDGGEITVVFDNGTNEKILLTSNGVTVSGFDTEKTGEQTLVIKYLDKETSFSVSVVERIGISAEITKKPKLSYVVGDELSLEDGEITITYNDNTTETVKLEELTVNGYDKNKTGEQTVTVEYSGLTTTFEVSVYETQEELETAVENVALSDIKIWSSERTVFVENAKNEIFVIDMSGRFTQKIKPVNNRTEIYINKGGLYIIKTGLKTQKVVIY